MALAAVPTRPIDGGPHASAPAPSRPADASADSPERLPDGQRTPRLSEGQREHASEHASPDRLPEGQREHASEPVIADRLPEGQREHVHPTRQKHGGSKESAARAAAPAAPRSLNGDPALLGLIEKVKAGDREALDALTRLIRPHVERQLARYPVSDDDRLDLVQSTLLQVVRRIRSFRGDSSFTTWLFRVTANEALMLMRSQRRQRARLVEGLDLEDLSALPTVRTSVPEDDAASLAEREAHVRHALGELPEDYRDVVLAHYHDDLGLHEIAEKFMVSESAVRSRLHRARVRLRAILNATPLGRELSEAAA